MYWFLQIVLDCGKEDIVMLCNEEEAELAMETWVSYCEPGGDAGNHLLHINAIVNAANRAKRDVVVDLRHIVATDKWQADEINN